MRNLLLLIFLALMGCNQAGPVKLQGLDHMRSYLHGHNAWQSWASAEELEQYWSFKEDGSFIAWTENLDGDGLIRSFPEVFPDQVYRVTGEWAVEKVDSNYTLELSQIKSPDGRAIGDADLDLGWVDGKLRILIGHTHYMEHWIPDESDTLP